MKINIRKPHETQAGWLWICFTGTTYSGLNFHIGSVKPSCRRWGYNYDDAYGGLSEIGLGPLLLVCW